MNEKEKRVVTKHIQNLKDIHLSGPEMSEADLRYHLKRIEEGSSAFDPNRPREMEIFLGDLKVKLTESADATRGIYFAIEVRGDHSKCVYSGTAVQLNPEELHAFLVALTERHADQTSDTARSMFIPSAWMDILITAGKGRKLRTQCEKLRYEPVVLDPPAIPPGMFESDKAVKDAFQAIFDGHEKAMKDNRFYRFVHALAKEVSARRRDWQGKSIGAMLDALMGGELESDWFDEWLLSLPLLSLHSTRVARPYTFCTSCEKILPLDTAYEPTITGEKRESLCGPCSVAKVALRYEEIVSAKEAEIWDLHRKQEAGFAEALENLTVGTRTAPEKKKSVSLAVDDPCGDDVAADV